MRAYFSAQFFLRLALIPTQVFGLIIDSEKCIGCWRCMRYCPFGAIHQGDDVASIDLDGCVECGVCLRSGACRVDALYMQEMSWPRAIRATFSGGGFGFGTQTGRRSYERIAGMMNLPRRGIKEALEGQMPGGGRGTSEMKTNDTTGRYTYGMVGVAAELGRPGIGFYFRELEKVAMVFAKHGAEFESENPVTVFLDIETGRIKEEYADIRQERARSGIIEALFPEQKIVEVFHALEEVGKELDTVFTVDIISKCKDGTIPVTPILDEARINVRINGKTNVGLGRPLAA
jgi:Pyruvate/2-oxoacid:ferredoxin oxidoreductase delta subunit